MQICGQTENDTNATVFGRDKAGGEWTIAIAIASSVTPVKQKRKECTNRELYIRKKLVRNI
jgi:hypothetical protein